MAAPEAYLAFVMSIMYATDPQVIDTKQIEIHTFATP